MQYREIELPSFDEMVKIHQEGRLDELLEAKNQEFMAAVPEDAKIRPGLERLQFEMRGLRARHQGLGRVLALSRLMHEKFGQMGELLFRFAELHYFWRSAKEGKLVLVQNKDKRIGKLQGLSGIYIAQDQSTDERENA